jgi:hypothetical protein
VQLEATNAGSYKLPRSNLGQIVSPVGTESTTPHENIN